MPRADIRIYVAHAVFWVIFAIGDLAARRVVRKSDAPRVPPPSGSAEPLRAPRAGLLVAIHMVAFALMYSGIGNAVFGRRLPATTTLVRALGAAVIVAGALFAAWARMSFASWRFRAQLDAGHQLATGGPFRIVRHPIYAALDLLALGTALWIPTPMTWTGAALMIVGGDLRARGEEPLLERAFGDEYRAYMQRTPRFIPGIY